MNRTAGRAAALMAAALMAAALMAAGLMATGLGSIAAAAPAPLAIDQLAAKGDADQLDVGSFAVQGEVPNKYSGYGANLPPDLYWTGGPSGTQSYVVLVEDADAQAGGGPVAHWVVFNIPEFVTSLPDSGRWDTPPPGLLTGANVTGAAAYQGPKPPPGPEHHYHFEVFAVDRTLPLAQGASRDAVREAMKGHVLAKGETVAAYKAP